MEWAQDLDKSLEESEILPKEFYKRITGEGALDVGGEQEHWSPLLQARGSCISWRVDSRRWSEA